MERIKELGTDCSSSVSGKAQAYLDEFDSHIGNDLATPRAMSVLWNMLKDEEITDSDKLYCVKYMDQVLGLKLNAAKDTASEFPAELMELIEQRTVAKKNKDWAKADEIRNRIEEMGYMVKDTPQGPVPVKKV
jgi:cysteinyl-tRNA synthetase